LLLRLEQHVFNAAFSLPGTRDQNAVSGKADSLVNVLLTGGTGYIGSHAAVVLLEAGHNVVLYDNLSNSQAAVADRVRHIAGRPAPFVQGDIRSTAQLEQVMHNHGIEAVVHFAGLKAVGESVARPVDYFDNNVGGTISLLNAMQNQGVRKLVFSSSATVYGNPQYLPLNESHPTGATNPYGRTKLHIEEMLADLADSNPDWRISSLRYFNPAGAHPSGLIGEDPNGIPNNLMPYIARVAAGKLQRLGVFGNDYDTLDGTGVRDYIHVLDLAEGHLAALQHLNERSHPYDVFNLGSGSGYSVLEMVRAFEQAAGVSVPYAIEPRRPGDVASCYANPDKALKVLGWRTRRSLHDMCASMWAFQQGRPAGGS
jgi:UDP-glucose 4-epimerase